MLGRISPASFGPAISRLGWSAILAGVFAALALQTLLELFGAALGLSLGDGVLEGGFALFVVLARLVALATGAALAGYLSPGRRPVDGAIAGVMTWAIAVVVSGVALVKAVPQEATPATWSAFVGALLGLGAALVGGTAGARIQRRTVGPAGRPPEILTPTPPSPV